MKPSAKIIMGIVVIVLAALVVFTVTKNKGSQDQEPLVSGFAWRYQDGVSGTDGLPQTQIFVDVSYENGKVISVAVDQVQGSCNDIDPKPDDADRVVGTTKIQCYAAGFGQWYKIVRGDDAYEILRKYFEEAGPGSVPPDYEYETVAEVPLLQ